MPAWRWRDEVLTELRATRGETLTELRETRGAMLTELRETRTELRETREEMLTEFRETRGAMLGELRGTRGELGAAVLDLRSSIRDMKASIDRNTEMTERSIDLLYGLIAETRAGRAALEDLSDDIRAQRDGLLLILDEIRRNGRS